MSMKVCTIASGSKGNCVYVASSNTELVIDLGISCRRAKREISALGGSGIENILLTHMHTDHFGHVPMALKHGSHLYYHRSVSLDTRQLEGSATEVSSRFSVGDISVLPFNVSHDVPCVGYQLKCGNSKVSVVTDIGYLPAEIMDIIAGSGLVILESNYDEDMLRDNPNYPYPLKQRIAGTRGHLSNTAAANAVAELAKSGVQQIVLAHVSENNNTPRHALDCSLSALDRIKMADKVKLSVAAQREVSQVFEV